MYSERIKNLPPYLFAAIDQTKQEARAKGIDIIDLSVGDPDMPTPLHIVEALKKASDNPENHQYPSYAGKLAFRTAMADWYKDIFGVNLDPEREVLTLIGSKEGLAHAPLAFINPGDLALVPDPAYTVYKTSVIFAGGMPITLPLLRKNRFLPDLEAIAPEMARKSRIIFLNYPNNPTGASADRKFFKKLVDFAKDYQLLVMHDNPYSEVYYDDQRSLSILMIEGAKDVSVEFHSLSKTYNMTGWRIGAVVGNPEIVAGIGKVKSNIDSGDFGAVQDAGIVALRSPQSKEAVEEIRRVYKYRIDILYRCLKELGLELEKPRATLYLWGWIGENSTEFCKNLLENAGIVATPGIGFGQYGEGYVRFSITQPTSKIEMAVERLERLGSLK